MEGLLNSWMNEELISKYEFNTKWLPWEKVKIEKIDELSKSLTLSCLLLQGPPGDIPNYITEARSMRGLPGPPVGKP